MSLSAICTVFVKYEAHPEAIKVYDELRRSSVDLVEAYQDNDHLFSVFKDKIRGEKMDNFREHVMCTLLPIYDQNTMGVRPSVRCRPTSFLFVTTIVHIGTLPKVISSYPSMIVFTLLLKLSQPEIKTRLVCFSRVQALFEWSMGSSQRRDASKILSSQHCISIIAPPSHAMCCIKIRITILENGRRWVISGANDVEG